MNFEQLIAEYREIQQLLSLPVVTDQELLALPFPEGAFYVMARGRYNGRPSVLRVTNNHGTRQVHVDLAYHFHDLNARVENIFRQIGMAVIEQETANG